MRQQRHRDALARREQHVHLAAAGLVGDVVGEADEVVGRLAHRRDDDDDVVAGPAGARDVIGDGPDAIRVGDRGAAELLDEESHGSQGYRRPRCAHGRISRPVHSAADAQRRQARSARRRTRELRTRGRARPAAAQEAQRGRRSARSAIVVAIFVVVIVLLNVISGSDNKKASPSTTTTTQPTDDDRSRFRRRPRRTPATINDATSGTIVLALDTKDDADRRRHTSSSSPSQASTTGSRWHRIVKDFVIQGGDPAATAPTDSGYPWSASSRRTAIRSGPSRPRRPSNDPRHVRLAVLHRRPEPQGADARRPTTRDFGTRRRRAWTSCRRSKRSRRPTRTTSPTDEGRRSTRSRSRES